MDAVAYLGFHKGGKFSLAISGGQTLFSYFFLWPTTIFLAKGVMVQCPPKYATEWMFELELKNFRVTIDWEFEFYEF